MSTAHIPTRGCGDVLVWGSHQGSWECPGAENNWTCPSLYAEAFRRVGVAPGQYSGAGPDGEGRGEPVLSVLHGDIWPNPSQAVALQRVGPKL